MFSIFSVNWDPALKVNTDAPYDYTKPARLYMGYDLRHSFCRYSEVLLSHAVAKAMTGLTDELAF